MSGLFIRRAPSPSSPVLHREPTTARDDGDGPGPGDDGASARLSYHSSHHSPGLGGGSHYLARSRSSLSFTAYDALLRDRPGRTPGKLLPRGRTVPAGLNDRGRAGAAAGPTPRRRLVKEPSGSARPSFSVEIAEPAGRAGAGGEGGDGEAQGQGRRADGKDAGAGRTAGGGVGGGVRRRVERLMGIYRGGK